MDFRSCRFDFLGKMLKGWNPGEGGFFMMKMGKIQGGGFDGFPVFARDFTKIRVYAQLQNYKNLEKFKISISKNNSCPHQEKKMSSLKDTRVP